MPLLLDNNVFRAITTKEGSGDPNRFMSDVRSKNLVPPGDPMPLALTPFILLEAIGIVPPTPALAFTPITIDPDDKDANIAAAMALLDGMLKESLDFYDNCPEIAPDRLQEKAAEQRRYTKEEAFDFFDCSITRTLDQPAAHRHMVACLAVDALFKFRFPSDQAAYCHAQFLTQLLSNDELDNATAMFRVVRRMCEEIFSQIYRDPNYNRQTLDTINDHLSIKNHRDFVDCELVHYLYIGYVVGDQRLPVVGFTMDDITKVATRISALKSITEAYCELNETVPNVCQGTLVQYKDDGTLGDFTPVDEIGPLL